MINPESEVASMVKAPFFKIIDENNCKKKSNSIRKNENLNSIILWSIDDDSFFCPRNLVQYKMECGRILFLTWNEDYLLNFFFKVSKNNEQTSLTRIRMLMPFYEGTHECIQQLLIIDCNTLLLMESGLVYYFTNTKNVEILDSLENVKCLSAINAGGFSLIRCCLNDNKCHLYLEIYLDTVDIRNSNNFHQTLMRRYNITFDEYGIFTCCWNDERYTLNTFLVNKDNQELLNKLCMIDGEIYRQSPILEEGASLISNQVIHVFTISGNLFMLVDYGNSAERGAHRIARNFQLKHLNFYSSNIECVKLEFRKQLIIVLLESALIDVWYISHKLQGALRHRTLQLQTQYLHYDYRPLHSIFYFVFDCQIAQLRITTKSNQSSEFIDGSNSTKITLTPSEECTIEEIYKDIAGIAACTWCESMQQLICLSFNNIFYGITFLKANNTEEGAQEDCYQLYELTNERIKILLQQSHLLNDLIIQPKKLQAKIEDEHRKQLVLATSNRKTIISKLFNAFVSFYVYSPTYEQLSIHKNVTLIKYNFSSVVNSNKSENNYFICINLQYNKSTDVFTCLGGATFWYLHFNTNDKSIIIYLPNELLMKPLFIIFESRTINSGEIKSIPNISLNLFTFVDVIGNYLSITIPIELKTHHSTFCSLFTCNEVYNMAFDYSKRATVNCFLEKYFDKIGLKAEYEQITEISHVIVLPHPKVFVTLLETLNLLSPPMRLHSEIEILQNQKKHQSDHLVATNIYQLYYLNMYLLTLCYDEKRSSMTVTSQHPTAVFYIKLHCYLQMKTQRTSFKSKLEEDRELEIDFATILNYKCVIERALGNRLLEVDKTSTSPRMETVTNFYHHLRHKHCKAFT